MQMQTLNGLGDGIDLTSILSSVGASVTPALQAEAEQIIVPIIAPYAIALVLLSVAGLFFGVSAYNQVKSLKKRLVRKAPTPAATP